MIEEEFIPALIADLVCESLVSTHIAMDGDWINKANVKGALFFPHPVCLVSGPEIIARRIDHACTYRD
jgi:hypothetical protein